MNKMGRIQQITALQELDHIWEYAKEKEVLLFKHSTTCPISANAYEQVQQASNTPEMDEIKIVMVHVIEDRPISNEIANRLQIAHESPQIFFIRQGQVIWYASHWNITKEAILKAQQLSRS
jgi:bacillithiol system protein YtxJ